MEENIIENAWEIKSSDLKIAEAKIILVPISELNPHPDNRPLGPNEDKIKQLKSLMEQNGFDSSHPLVIRPYATGYQILEGEHRYAAAKSLGYLQIPCVVRTYEDTEALIQLVLGNIQSDNKPLEIGLNALKVVQKDNKKGYSASAYAKRLGMSETSVRRYLNASEVYQFVKLQLPEGTLILDEVYKLEEIHKIPQTDWVWLHDFVQKNELSQKQAAEICNTLKEIKTEKPEIYTLFDFLSIRQEVAHAYLKGQKNLGETYKDLFQTTEDCIENLEESIEVFEYNVLLDAVQGEKVLLREWYIAQLKNLKSLNKQNVLETYKDALQLKRNGSKDEAERTAYYFRDKKNLKEREEQERLEREMRTIQAGDWWQLGNHFLYCGECASPEFVSKIPVNTALAYLYHPNIDQWLFDFLGNKVRNIAVSLPINQLQKAFQSIHIPYRWSFSSQIEAGSWLPTLVFSTQNATSPQVDCWNIDKLEKSYDLTRPIVENLTRENEVVLDMFAENENFLVMIEKMHRIAYLSQADADICRKIIENWEVLTGQNVRKLK
ncbi:MAG: hypothetical protein EAZ85_13830 [Bacteroidetes bacterium]|nr:MAG: hypothetical protein EAZ85_13830 [Bacteroidota bacterium]TAG87056.1 MAG: hypothetical protein EAZ20_11475 [Bacteroidota bacterium]